MQDHGFFKSKSTTQTSQIQNQQNQQNENIENSLFSSAIVFSQLFLNQNSPSSKKVLDRNMSIHDLMESLKEQVCFCFCCSFTHSCLFVFSIFKRIKLIWFWDSMSNVS